MIPASDPIELASSKLSRGACPIAGKEDRVLVTGASGFVGSWVVRNLLDRGFRRVRCLMRPSSDLRQLHKAIGPPEKELQLEIMTGNLLSRDVARKAAEGVTVIYHLAAGTGSKSFPDSFLNSVVATRNLIDAALNHGCLKRFVSLSSFTVYSNIGRRSRILDESSPIETHPQSRAEAYCYGKVKQDALVLQYGTKYQLPFVLVRPGVVYGPGKHSIPGRVGVDTFGFFMHLGGSNTIPLTYVENCADAIVMAGLSPGIDGEVFNVVDDDLPTSRQFLRAHRHQVKPFRSLYLPKAASYAFCLLWEKCAAWSGDQLPAVFTRREWHAYWKPTIYSNRKLKQQLGWSPRVCTEKGLQRYFSSCREAMRNA